jgi:hypothetical protein
MFDRPPLLEEPFAQTLSGKNTLRIQSVKYINMKKNRTKIHTSSHIIVMSLAHICRKTSVLALPASRLVALSRPDPPRRTVHWWSACSAAAAAQHEAAKAARNNAAKAMAEKRICTKDI